MRSTAFPASGTAAQMQAFAQARIETPLPVFMISEAGGAHLLGVGHSLVRLEHRADGAGPADGDAGDERRHHAVADENLQRAGRKGTTGGRQCQQFIQEEGTTEENAAVGR